MVGSFRMFKLGNNFTIKEVSNSEHNVGLINYFKNTYDDVRGKSKTVTFALQYAGTWRTLVKNSGFAEDDAKSIVQNYDTLYQESAAFTAAKVEQSCIDGYVKIAFGLKLRTPLLKKSVLGNRYTTNEAKAEARTVGNALSQSYGLLNNRAAVAFMKIVWKSKHRLKIMPVALIHDAIYLIIDDDLETIEFANKHLTKEMEWQELPEIAHDKVKLGSDLDLFYPDWSHGITLKRTASKSEICDVVDKAMETYHAKQKKAV